MCDFIEFPEPVPIGKLQTNNKLKLSIILNPSPHSSVGPKPSEG